MKFKLFKKKEKAEDKTLSDLKLLSDNNELKLRIIIDTLQKMQVNQKDPTMINKLSIAINELIILIPYIKK